jgi:hypothetical protein
LRLRDGTRKLNDARRTAMPDTVKSIQEKILKDISMTPDSLVQDAIDEAYIQPTGPTMTEILEGLKYELERDKKIYEKALKDAKKK